MEIIETVNIKDWFTPVVSEQQREATEAIENGKIIFLPHLAFNLSGLEQRFLAPHYVDAKAKNISYDLRTHTIQGVQGSPNDKEQLQAMIKRFAMHARHLVTQLFPHYQGSLQQARTSFRPVEVSNRKTSYRKDDKRLHVDAFPSAPNQGKRILRVFTNVNSQGEDRVWRIGEPFAEVAKQFLPKIGKPLPGGAKLMELFNITKSRRTHYDHIMLQIHDRMKADENYQQNVQQQEVRFPPATTWIVQTDQVSHAAMSGQYLLEQTFYLPVDAMHDPARSPLRILEQMMGHPLV